MTTTPAQSPDPPAASGRALAKRSPPPGVTASERSTPEATAGQRCSTPPLPPGGRFSQASTVAAVGSSPDSAASSARTRPYARGSAAGLPSASTLRRSAGVRPSGRACSEEGRSRPGSCAVAKTVPAWETGADSKRRPRAAPPRTEPVAGSSTLSCPVAVVQTTRPSASSAAGCTEDERAVVDATGRVVSQRGDRSVSETAATRPSFSVSTHRSCCGTASRPVIAPTAYRSLRARGTRSCPSPSNGTSRAVRTPSTTATTPR